MVQDKIRRLILATIASREIPKKRLARKCKVSKPYFSQMLHGDVSIPVEIRAKLISELGLEAVIEKLEKI